MAVTNRLVVLLALLPALMAGCAALEEEKQECCSSCQDQWDAWCAWHRAKPCYSGEPHLHAFGAGFRAGYIHIMNGGDGCPPMLAPRKYWGENCCNRSPGCESPSLAWFNGFSQGVVQGLYEGVAGRNVIVTSRDLYGQCQEEIDIHAMLEHCQQQGPMHGPTPADEFEWSPQPLPAGAVDELHGAEEIWNDEFFPGTNSEEVDAPLLQPVEQLPTQGTDDEVSPALIEFLDQGV